MLKFTFHFLLEWFTANSYKFVHFSNELISNGGLIFLIATVANVLDWTGPLCYILWLSLGFMTQNEKQINRARPRPPVIYYKGNPSCSEIITRVTVLSTSGILLSTRFLNLHEYTSKFKSSFARVGPYEISEMYSPTQELQQEVQYLIHLIWMEIPVWI